MIKKFILIVLFVFILTGCTETIEQDEPYVNSWGYNFERENIYHRIYFREYIAVIEIVEIVETIQYNTNDIGSSYIDVPFTHVKCKVLYILKGEIIDETIDMILLGGDNSAGDFISRSEYSISPKVGETYLTFFEETNSVFQEFDSRIFLNAYSLTPDFLDMFYISDYSEQGDISDQNADIREMIRELELDISEIDGLTEEEVYNKNKD